MRQFHLSPSSLPFHSLKMQPISLHSLAQVKGLTNSANKIRKNMKHRNYNKEIVNK
jgi:hypothetical protein